MKILLTGAAGFIGSHTAQALLEAGHTVIGIDNVNDYYNTSYKEENLQSLTAHENFSFYKLDISDNSWTEIPDTKEIDVVIHLAARAGVRPSIADPLLYQRVNSYGTNLVFEFARKNNIKNVIFASSSSVYGNRDNAPFTETDDVSQPISPYAATKRNCELIAYNYHHLFNINTIGLRFFTVYGEGGRPDMAPYIFTKAALTGAEIKKFGKGDSKRDYTYVKDIVSGILACLGKDVGYEIINLGNSNPVSLNEFIATVEEVTGKKLNIKQIEEQAGDVKLTCADISKAKKLLNWQPQTSLKDGLTNFVEWFKNARLEKYEDS